MTKPDYIAEIKKDTPDVADIASMLRRCDGDDWVDAIHTALQEQKNAIALTLLKAGVDKLDDDQKALCTIDMVEYLPAKQWRPFVDQCPSLFTPHSTREMLKATVEFSKPAIAATLLPDGIKTLPLLNSDILANALLKPSALDEHLRMRFSSMSELQRDAYTHISMEVGAQRARLHLEASERRSTARARRICEEDESRAREELIMRRTSSIDNAYQRQARIDYLREHLPQWQKSNPTGKEEALTIPEMIEQAFVEKRDLSGFLELVQENWSNDKRSFTPKQLIKHCRTLLDQQGGSTDVSDDQLLAWLQQRVNKSDVILTGMDFFAQALGIPEEHQNLLWRIKRGEYLEEAQIRPLIESKDRKALYLKLYEASGLPKRSIDQQAKMNSAIDNLQAHGTALNDQPKAHILAEMFYPSIPMDDPKALAFRRQIEASLLDRELPPTLSDLILQALEKDGNPKENFIKSIVGGEGIKGINAKTGEELAALLTTQDRQVDARDANKFRSCYYEIREPQAKVFVELARQGGVSVLIPEEEEALALLTGSKSPAEMLKDAVLGQYDIEKGKRDPENCLPIAEMIERWRQRKYVAEKNMVPDVSVKTFQGLRQRGIMDYDSAHKFAKYFKFNPQQTRQFVLKAVGEPVILNFNPVIDQLCYGEMERVEGLRLLCTQTGQTLRHLGANYRDEHYREGIPNGTITHWLRGGAVPCEGFMEYLAEKLGAENREDDLKYVFLAKSPKQETEYTKMIESERQNALSRIAGQIETLGGGPSRG